MKEHKYNNTVIQSKGGEHGKRVIEWWESQGVDTDNWNGDAIGGYYGLIDGEFTFFRTLPANATIIELPESKPQDLIGRNVSTTPQKLFNYLSEELGLKMKAILKKLGACDEAIEWVGDRTIEQAINECERGDWMLWLFQQLFPDELQLLTLAKGHCANTVRHLMSEVSIKAVDTAIAFGEGGATKEELYSAASAAYAAAADASARAKKANQKKTADICRKYLGEKLVEGCNKFKEVSNG